MIRWYGRPDRVALAMIAALENGAIQTPGQWSDFLIHLQGLPPKLQIWTIDKIREITGDTACSYLVSRMILLRSRQVGVRT